MHFSKLLKKCTQQQGTLSDKEVLLLVLLLLLLWWRHSQKARPPLNNASKLASLFQFLTFRSSLMSMSIALTHLFFDFPTGVFPIMLLFRILFGMPFSSIRRTWPAHCSHFNLIILYKLGSSNFLCNSLLHIILHVLFYFIGPNILLSRLTENLVCCNGGIIFF
jgi:hypothetical protein